MDILPLRERLRQWTADRQQKAAGQQQEAKRAKRARFRLMLLLVLVAFFVALLRILAYWLSGT